MPQHSFRSQEANPIVMWELTRACDVHCRNCSIGATENRGTNELTTYEVYKTIDQIDVLTPREFIVTGGDPLARDDIAQVINYSRRRSLDPGLVVSPSSRLTAEAVSRLERNGLTRMIFPLAGSTPSLHEEIQGAKATFGLTLEAMRWAESAGLAVEVNTLVTRSNAKDLPAIADLIRPVGISRWNLYFPVPVVAAVRASMLTAEEAEQVFGVVREMANRETFAIRLFEAPHYRRHLLQRNLEARLDLSAGDWEDFRGYNPGVAAGGQASIGRDLVDAAVENARGFVFISHAGDVRVSEFLPASAGNLRYRPLSDIYRNSELFMALRDPVNLKGKCGRCEYHHLCSGSRARAWAMTGDLFADDPMCAYEPGAPITIAPTAPARAEASS